MKLEMELIPQSSWGLSLANKLPKEEWDSLRQKTYCNADYKCEVCGNGKETLHAHEVWRFEERARIQRFVRLECRCKTCHDFNHFGRSKAVYDKAYVDKLIQHWCNINKKTLADFRAYEQKVYNLYKKRADKFYTVKAGRKVLY